MLNDVSLAAIVRDEIMNPAGGITDFLDSTMPFVETGVVVDTGSTDGTREALEEYSAKYRNLKIYDRPFDGFAKSRNFALDNTKTKYALVLDADERITEKGFDEVQEVMKAGTRAYNFPFMSVMPNSFCISYCSEDPTNLNPRLFKKTGVKFMFDVYETPLYKGVPFPELTGKNETKQLDRPWIYHFKPEIALQERKHTDFYKKIRAGGIIVQLGKFLGFEIPAKQPKLSDLPYYDELRQLNPGRQAYK